MKLKIFVRISACALALPACHRMADQADAPHVKVSGEKIEFLQPTGQVPALAVAAPEKSRTTLVHLNGRLVWDEDVTVHVFPPYSGRISQVVAQAGQRVGVGEPLAMIASADYGQAQADARRAEVDFQLAERTWNRLKGLEAHGAAPLKDVNAAEADYVRAKSEMQRTALRLRIYGCDTNSADHIFQLKSPLAGTVVEKNINPGQEVRSDLGNAPLFVITDPSRLWIQLDATEQDLLRLKPGRPISIRTPTYPGQAFAGKIEVIADFLDSASRTIKVRGSIDNSNRLLKAEMFVSADLETDEPDALRVPAKAVFLRGNSHYLFVEGARAKYERREVQIGAEHDGKIVVLGGLEPEQRVVVDASLLLDQLMSEAGS